jgi:hypothetical protein
MTIATRFRHILVPSRKLTSRDSITISFGGSAKVRFSLLLTIQTVIPENNIATLAIGSGIFGDITAAP